jgi:hypothetical protein
VLFVGRIQAGDFVMCLRFIPVAVAALLLGGSLAHAQCGCGVAPVVAAAPTYAVNYAPAVTSAVAYEAPVTYTSNYAPAYTTYYAPTVAYQAPVTYTSYYAPTTAYAAPVSYASYYAPAAVPYTTYYSPRVVAAPVAYSTYYYGVPGTSIYGAPRVYVPGEPVRNTLRALTP